MRRLLPVCSLVLLPLGCLVVDNRDGGDDFGDDIGDETGDGDGDPTTGDGDGDGDPDPTTGDGDGDGDPTTGDGDGDPDPTTGDGDGDGDGDPDPGNPYSADASYCVDVINMYRATEDLPPLERWVDAEECSNGEAESDGLSNTPHGAFGDCGEFAQNECPGWPGPPMVLLDGCLAQMWAEGPGEPFSEHGHYLNMSSTSYTKVACGFYETAQGSFWAVQNFK